jgi:chromosome segregation ATPase
MRLLVSVLSALACGERAPHTATGVAFVQSATNLARSLQLTEEDDIPDLEHMHLVCHRHGCKEVKATLDVIKIARKSAQAGLAQCAKERSALAATLGKVSQERGKVEADLAACAANRTVLEGKVAECGKHRAEVEAALAKCATERAALEKELKQCAEVDRPAAEKALAECGRTRAQLEKQLKELEERLKNGAASRRRSSRRRKESLVETNSTEEHLSDVESSEESGLNAQISMIQSQLFAEKVKQNDLTLALGAYEEQLEAAAQAIKANDGQFDELTAKLLSNSDDMATAQAGLQQVQQDEESALAQSGSLGDAFAEISSEAETLVAKEATAAADLHRSSISLAKTQSQLLSLLMEDQTDLEQQLVAEQEQTTAKLAEQRALLSHKEKENEECDDLRVEVITLAASVKSTGKQLADCLATKKELNLKIAAAQEATNKARAGLQNCLRTKASLTAALQECHDRCAKTEKLLNECLARKKVLKTKINECHTARDLARSKLKECLDKKEELKTKIEALKAKIAAMGLLQDASSSDEELSLASAVHSVLGIMADIDDVEKEALKDSVAVAGSQGKLLRFDEGTSAYLQTANNAFESTQQAFAQASEALADLQEEVSTVAAKLSEAGSDTDEAQAEAQNAAAAASAN